MKPSRILPAAFAAILSIVIVGARLSAQEGSHPDEGSGPGARGAEVAIEGEVIDLAGWLADAGNRGEGYKGVCKKCIGAGMPVGILTDGGDAYLVLGFKDSSRKVSSLAKDAAHRVEATGTVHERGGVRGVLISSMKSHGHGEGSGNREGPGRAREGSGR